MATILVVDDDAMTARLLSYLIEDASHDVLVADAARAALELARERRPDLALIDWMLPGVDGAQLCHALRADDTTAGMPLVAMSAGIVHGWQEAGANAFITKPLDIPALRALIARLLSDNGGDAPRIGAA
jgi:DNA-binding response OmpR family regulator